MIRYLKKYGFPLLVLLVLSGCARVEEEDIVQYVPKPSEEICFQAQMAGTATKGDIRHAGYLDIQEEEWPLEGSVSTKADAKESLLGGFVNAGVRIFLYDGDWSAATASSDGTPIDVNTTPALPGRFNAEGLLTPINPYTGEDRPILWVEAKKDSDNYYEHMRTYAFAPFLSVPSLGIKGIHSMVTEYVDPDDPGKGMRASYIPGNVSTPVIPSITYTVPDEPEDQCDLIAGYSGEVAGDLRAVVPMTFHHVFSAVQFKLDFEQTVRVKSLTLSGVYKKGTGYIDDSGRQIVDAWDDADDDGTPDEIGDDLYAYTFAFTGDGGYTEYEAVDGHTTEYDGVLTSGDRTLMMVPQTLPAGASLTLVYQVNDSGWQTRVMTCPLSGMIWRPGYRYIYTIKETPRYDIYFDLAADNVTITNGSYTGKVYVGGVATTVSGTHYASNRYYVYQSTGTTEGPYDKDHTGWETAIGTGVCRIPAYPEMQKDGKAWSEYITDNWHTNEVIEAWPVSAAAAGRTITGNRIAYNNVSKAEIVIDNIWTEYKNSSTRGSIWSAGGSVQNTLLVKGDSRLHCLTADANAIVYYDKATINDHVFSVSDPYFKISSYYGDGSSRGSLTIMPPTTTTVYPNAHYMLKAGTGSQSSETASDQYFGRLIVAGGTLFVANPEITGGETTAAIGKYPAAAMGCIGPECNRNGYMEFTGGTVTAVAHGTAAAIGGGCAYNEVGGTGIVNISGKTRIYAYQFGMDGRSFTVPMPSTAIGGCCTFRGPASTGCIKIWDDAYVYAQSRGGVAIGGGTSTMLVGGDAYVKILDRATVVAKSLPGTIPRTAVSAATGYDGEVHAATAIGGGSGGTGRLTRRTDQYRTSVYDPNGGTAVVTIAGTAKVIASSVGGGVTGFPETYTLGSADINVSGSPEIQAQFIMAAGSAVAPSFTMSGGTLSPLAASQEFVSYNENTIHQVLHTYTNGDFYFTEPDGGAVYIETGTCTISGGLIDGFTARNGGAVWMGGGTFNMNGGTIRNCRAVNDSSLGSGGNGGAVYVQDASGLALVNLTGGTIQGNYADYNGGGVYLQGGNVNMLDTNGGCTISGNKALDASGTDAKGNGGGIYLNKGNFTMTGGSINGNTANRNGGGVWVSSEDTDLNVTVTGGAITTNQSERFGAGLYVLPGDGHTATVNIGTSGAPYSNTNPDITGNSASLRGGAIYASGSGATINLYDGRINGNYVSAYAYNQDITNEEGGQVFMELNGGVPVPNVEYITVTIDPAGGDFTDGETAGDPVKRYLVKATNSTLTFPTPKRKNFSFVGWLPSQGEGDTGYSTYTSGMIFNYDKDLTLTAQWESL